MSAAFRTTALDPGSAARAGLLQTPHGAVETPAFMPVASQGTVKALTHDQLEALGADIILLNSYHLSLRPGLEDIEALLVHLNDLTVEVEGKENVRVFCE